MSSDLQHYASCYDCFLCVMHYDVNGDVKLKSGIHGHRLHEIVGHGLLVPIEYHCDKGNKLFVLTIVIKTVIDYAVDLKGRINQ